MLLKRTWRVKLKGRRKSQPVSSPILCRAKEREICKSKKQSKCGFNCQSRSKESNMLEPKIPLLCKTVRMAGEWLSIWRFCFVNQLSVPSYDILRDGHERCELYTPAKESEEVESTKIHDRVLSACCIANAVQP